MLSCVAAQCTSAVQCTSAARAWLTRIPIWEAHTLYVIRSIGDGSVCYMLCSHLRRGVPGEARRRILQAPGATGIILSLSFGIIKVNEWHIFSVISVGINLSDPISIARSVVHFIYLIVSSRRASHDRARAALLILACVGETRWGTRVRCTPITLGSAAHSHFRRATMRGAVRGAAPV